VFDVIDLINRDYPRAGIARPELTAGTCLRKDLAVSEERSNAPGMLLAVSRVNESVPLFLRLLDRELADVAVHDPNVLTPTQSLEEAVRDTDAVVVATNHSAFDGPARLREIAELAAEDCLVVDPWNSFGSAQVFAYAAEVAQLTGAK
jgi:UDP-N-acetyl-D-mannosaminuronic acid dehydrogenase